MNIGEVLRAWRCHNELTLKEAAERIGVSLPTLSHIELDRWEYVKGPTMWTLISFLFGPDGRPSA